MLEGVSDGTNAIDRVKCQGCGKSLVRGKACSECNTGMGYYAERWVGCVYPEPCQCNGCKYDEFPG